ncbi:MAG: hypothetical protein MUE49_03335 [Rhodospirillales bacterium]|jgi:cell division protein FtsL|nr:hypothetical protein [Rhodospirillales bacterium]
MSGWSSLMRRATVVSFVLVVTFAVALMSVKHRVQQLVDEAAQIERQIAAERQAVHVLTAEFSYLIKPDRLRRLASQHLGLTPVKPDQLGSFATLDQWPTDGSTVSAGQPLALAPLKPTATTERRR